MLEARPKKPPGGHEIGAQIWFDRNVFLFAGKPPMFRCTVVTASLMRLRRDVEAGKWNAVEAALFDMPRNNESLKYYRQLWKHRIEELAVSEITDSSDS